LKRRRRAVESIGPANGPPIGSKRPEKPVREASDLAALVRKSRLLDPVARRHWLSVLPYLAPRDRARLEAILQAELPAET
jgi:hypothetical protein